MKQLTKEQLSFLLQFPTGHRLQVGALGYIEKYKINKDEIDKFRKHIRRRKK